MDRQFPVRSRVLKCFSVLVRSSPRFWILSVLVLVDPGFLKFSRSWSELVLNFTVLVRPRFLNLKFAGPSPVPTGFGPLNPDNNENRVILYLRLWRKLGKFFIIMVSITLLFSQNSPQAKVNCILYADCRIVVVSNSKLGGIINLWKVRTESLESISELSTQDSEKCLLVCCGEADGNKLTGKWPINDLYHHRQITLQRTSCDIFTSIFDIIFELKW